MAVYEITVTQMLTIAQSTGNNPFGREVFQTLAITQAVKVMPHKEELVQTFEIGQQVDVRKSINNITVTQQFEMYQQGAKGPALQEVLHHFDMWHEARVVEYEAITQTLVINQTAVGVVSKNATNTLVIEQTVSVNVVRALTCTQTFVMQSGVAGYVPDEETYSITIPSFGGPNAPGC